MACDAVAGSVVALCVAIIGYMIFPDHCPHVSEPVEKFSSLVQQELFCQDDAREVVIKKLRLWKQQMDNGVVLQRPTLFYLLGDNGVGKSWMATLFQRTVSSPQTTLKLTPSAVNSAPELQRLIAEQVHKCPRSFIILDEFQLFPQPAITMFDQLLQNGQITFTPTVDGNPITISLHQTVFLLTSDLGHQFGSQPISAAEAIVFFQQFAAQQVGLNIQSHEVVAFLPLNKQIRWKPDGLGPKGLYDAHTSNRECLKQSIEKYYSDLTNHKEFVPLNLDLKFNLATDPMCLAEAIYQTQQGDSLQLANYRGFHETFVQNVVQKAKQELLANVPWVILRPGDTVKHPKPGFEKWKVTIATADSDCSQPIVSATLGHQ